MVIIFFSAHLSLALEYPSGFRFIEVPDPLSGNNPTYPLVTRSVPSVGESFYDDQFGTVLTRVTEIDNISGRHEYSRFDPFNVNHSRIILLFESDYDWKVYRTETMPYNQGSNVVRTLLGIQEPRWDPADPDILWYLQDFSIYTVNVETGQITTIKDFSSDATIGPIISSEPDLWRITTMSEGESSADKRYWVFFLQGANEDYRVRYIFTWDREQDQVPGVYQIPVNESNIDWVGMSSKGTWVLVGGDWDNGGNLAGLTMANRELTQFHRLDYGTAHSDVGLDSNGNEVIVMQNVMTDYIDLIPIDLNTQPILGSGGSYAGTNRTRLMRLFYDSESPFGFTSGVHISCNVPGYCVVSTSTEQGSQEQNWLDRTITLVRLDRTNPQVFYLAKVYGTDGTYWEETHATITNDGSKVVWATNWNQDVGAERVFLMQLDMPSNWKSLTVPFPELNPTGTTANLTGIPQVNTPVTLTVLTQGSGAINYRFYVGSNYGAPWTEVQPWSTNNSCTYTPTSEGNNVFLAHVSDNPTGGSYHQAGFSFATSGHSEAGVVIYVLSTNLGFPQTAGTPIDLTAQAYGTGLIYFKFWYKDDTGWHIIQDWSESNTATWTPTQPGTYILVVWANTTADDTIPNRPIAGFTFNVSQ